MIQGTFRFLDAERTIREATMYSEPGDHGAWRRCYRAAAYPRLVFKLATDHSNHVLENDIFRDYPEYCTQCLSLCSLLLSH
jgi:hypothetical protein